MRAANNLWAGLCHQRAYVSSAFSERIVEELTGEKG